MDLGISGRVALVTGASRGLGRAIAIRLAREGMHVAIAARDKASLDDAAAEISALGVKALPIGADLSTADAAEAVVKAAIAEFGQLNLLVNNAGATRRGDFLKLTDADWASGFDLKFFGAVRMARSAWPHLQTSKGMVLNIGGVGGFAAEDEFMIGGSVNAAVGLFTKALSDRGIRDGVRVLAIHPGTFETERFEKRVQTHMAQHNLTFEAAREAMLKEHKIARFGKPEELATLIAMLASDSIEFLQGAIIVMDGGQYRYV
ncbi:MAG: SDR family NAD(P)-dependent oxidoreductase [Pseudolabrys sp.]|nr:SDR family NAD(P)-dependent oxidoreductase [Pseudolabrys sp.]